MQTLIVSHLAPTRRTCELLTAELGQKTLFAGTVAEALDIFLRNAKINMLVCEWQLPDGTALDLHRKCRQIERCSDDAAGAILPKFVILTAPAYSLNQSERRAAIQNINLFGFEAVVEKPIDRSLFLTHFRQLLEQHRQETQAEQAKTAKPAAAEPEKLAGEAVEQVVARPAESEPMAFAAKKASAAAPAIDEAHLDDFLDSVTQATERLATAFRGKSVGAGA